MLVCLPFFNTVSIKFAMSLRCSWQRCVAYSDYHRIIHQLLPEEPGIGTTRATLLKDQPVWAKQEPRAQPHWWETVGTMLSRCRLTLFTQHFLHYVGFEIIKEMDIKEQTLHTAFEVLRFKFLCKLTTVRSSPGRLS